MSAFQVRLVAFALWLIALVMVIPPLALYEEWTPYRDGARVAAEVLDVKPRRKLFEVSVRYAGERATVYASERPGATLDVVVPVGRHAPIAAARLDQRRPSPWLILPLVGCPFVIVLGVLVWRAPSRAAKRRATRTNPLDAIVDAVRFTRNASVGLGLFFVASAGFAAIIPLFDREATGWMVIAIEIVALLSLGLAVWCFRRALQLADTRRNDVMDLIERRPRELAWFYVDEIKAQLGQRGYALRLCKTNGKQVSLNVVAEDIDALLAAIAQHAPHAQQGWSPEIARAYRQNPRGSLDVPSKPDHTVLFVPALAFLLASVIAAALLVAKALGRAGDAASDSGLTHQAIDSFPAAIADTLGLGGSIAVSAAVVAACAGWFVVALRRYRVATGRTRS